MFKENIHAAHGYHILYTYISIYLSNICSIYIYIISIYDIIYMILYIYDTIYMIYYMMYYMYMYTYIHTDRQTDLHTYLPYHTIRYDTMSPSPLWCGGGVVRGVWCEGG